MAASPRSAFAYAVVRVVPHVERGETMNAGVVLLCRPRRFLAAKVDLDETPVARPRARLRRRRDSSPPRGDPADCSGRSRRGSDRGPPAGGAIPLARRTGEHGRSAGGRSHGDDGRPGRDAGPPLRDAGPAAESVPGTGPAADRHLIGRGCAGGGVRRGVRRDVRRRARSPRPTPRRADSARPSSRGRFGPTHARPTRGSGVARPDR